MKVNNLLKMKQDYNKGITLIALVITIIVLLILAGISIATLTGENGILTQANKSKTETVYAQIKEEIRLAYNSIQIDSYTNELSTDEKAEELQKELQKEDSYAEVIINGTDLNISYKEYETTINSDGIMSELAKAKIIINKFEIEGTAVETAPVPTGFYHVGGTIDEGYVISDNVADKNKGVDSTELQGNQFVWIPVEKDQKILIDVLSEEEITSVVLTDPYGDDILIENNVGTSYINTEIEPTINGPYRLVITTNNREKRIFLGVHSLYAVDTFKDWEYTTKEEESLMNGSSLKNIYETEDYSEKVNDKGGFYIGRYESTYESSDDGGKLASKKSTSTRETNATELEDGMIWNCITRIDALTKAKKYNTTVTSTLLTGAAWDRIIGWLFETGEKTDNELHIDSKSWGNFADDTFSNTTGLINTGEYKETKANNIYDLAGNLEEWTTQAYDENHSLHRGGFYRYEGSVTPTTIRFVSGNTDVNKNICVRMALFL